MHFRRFVNYTNAELTGVSIVLGLLDFALPPSR